MQQHMLLRLRAPLFRSSLDVSCHSGRAQWKQIWGLTAAGAPARGSLGYATQISV